MDLISSVDDNQEQSYTEDGFGHVSKDMEEEESRQDKYDSDYDNILETIVRRQSVLAIHLDQLLKNDNNDSKEKLPQQIQSHPELQMGPATTTATITTNPIKHASISAVRQRLEEYNLGSNPSSQQPHLYIETQNLTKPKPATPLIHPSGVHTRTSSSGEFLRTQIEELKQISCDDTVDDDEIVNPQKAIPTQGTGKPKNFPHSNQEAILQTGLGDDSKKAKNESTNQHSRSQTTREKAKTISHQQPNAAKDDSTKFAVHRSVKSATTTAAAAISSEIFDIKKTLFNKKKQDDPDEEDDFLFIESINEPVMISPEATVTPVSPYKSPSANVGPNPLNHSDSFLVLPTQQLATQSNIRLNSPIKCTSLFECQHHRAKKHMERLTYFRQRKQIDEEEPSDEVDNSRSLFDPRTFESMFGNAPTSPSILAVKNGTDTTTEKEISTTSSEEFMNEEEEINEKMENIKAKLFDCVF